MDYGRVGLFGLCGGVGRAGRLISAVTLALAVTLAPVTPALARSETGRSGEALVCRMQPTRLGWRCFCRGAYGWRAAPPVMCRAAR